MSKRFQDVLDQHADDLARQQDYFRGLEWDGTNRLAHWLPEHLKAVDDPYSQIIGPKMIMGAVSRILDPGCALDGMPVLVGESGCGKSNTVHALGRPCELFPRCGNGFYVYRPTCYREEAILAWGAWYADIQNLHYQRIDKKNKIVNFLRMAVDVYKPIYGRDVMRFPRTLFPVGTYCSMYFLTGTPEQDSFFWPIRIGDVNTSKLRMDIPQLYAEGYTRLVNGESCLLSPAERDVVTLKQSVMYASFGLDRLRAYEKDYYSRKK